MQLSLPKVQTGMSLIEILIALAIGTMLLGAAAAVGLTSLSGNKNALINAKMQQELQLISLNMTRELRRSGYSATETSAPIFRQIWFFGGTGSDNHHCVVFRYDRTPESSSLTPPGNGVLSSDDVRGVRLNDGQIEVLTAGVTSTPGSCAAAGTWVATTSADLDATGVDIDYKTVRLKTDGSKVVDRVTITVTAAANNGNTYELRQSILLRNRPVLQ